MATPPSRSKDRLVSLDACRGFVMLVLASGGLGISAVAANLADAGHDLTGTVWPGLVFHTSHPEWNSQFWTIGCSCWDLIQPAFMFMVGVAMVFSYTKRTARGDSPWSRHFHAVTRAVLLVLLGVFLSSQQGPQTNWTFVNVLAQIGLAYLFVYALLGQSVLVQLLASVILLVGYWGAFVFYPAPPAAPAAEAADGQIAEQVEPTAQAAPRGFADRFEKDANVAAAFDRWFLNRFPRSEPFVANSGGYQTLNFVPSIFTILLGAMAGRLLAGPRNAFVKFLILVGGGAACMGIAVGVSPVGLDLCPVVKRIWTPAWALYSGAWVLWILAAFYLVIDCLRLKPLGWPLVVVGMNSIVVYMIFQLLKPWIARTLKIHFALPVRELWGYEMFEGLYGPMIQSVSVLAVIWLICLWLYRQRLFVRI